MKNIIKDFKNCDWAKVILIIIGLTPLMINDLTNLFWDKYEFAKCYITVLGIIYVVLFIRSAESLQSRSKFARAVCHMSNEELQKELNIMTKFFEEAQSERYEFTDKEKEIINEIYDQYMDIIEEEIDKRANCQMNGTNED